MNRPPFFVSWIASGAPGKAVARGTRGEALRAWLLEARSGARARPLEAQLQRNPQGFSGSIGLVLAGAAP